MHFTLRMLQTLLAAPNALRSAVKPAPVLSPAKWDYPAAPGEHFTVGTAKVSIVPGDLHAQKYYLAGYGANKPARGVLNPVYATALWLDDNTGHGGLLLISVDCVGIMHNDVEALRAHLAPLIERTGCRAMHVMSTHVHAGIDTMGFWGKFPRSGRNESYFRLLFGAIESAAEQAYATRRAGDCTTATCKRREFNRINACPRCLMITHTGFVLCRMTAAEKCILLTMPATPRCWAAATNC